MPGRGPALYFLDTNVFVYAFDSGAPVKRERALSLIRDAVRAGKGVISFQVVQEFLNVALRRFAQPMSHAEAEQYLNTIFRRLLGVHASIVLYQEALLVAQRYRLGWFDALIVAGAQSAGCDVLYSDDLQDGQTFGTVRVENPFA